MKRAAMKILAVVILTFSLFSNVVAADLRGIYVNLPTLTLSHYGDNGVVVHYPIAIGSPNSPTPTGNYRVIRKTIDPTWRPRNRAPVPPGPANPLGHRWIGFTGAYGIHGNNNPTAIESFVSAGCIRMYSHHVEELFERVKVGSPVRIEYKTIIPVVDKYSGRAIVKIYRDIYRMGTNSRENVINSLMANGIYTDGTITEGRFNDINLRNVFFAQGTPVVFNNRFLTDDSFKEDGFHWINYLALSDAFGLKLGFRWDERDDDKGKISSLYLWDTELEYFAYNGRTYIKIEDVGRIIGFKGNYRANIDTLYINHKFATINGNYFTSRVDFKYTGVPILNYPRPFVSLRDLADILGYDVKWDSERSIAMVGDKEFSGRIINSTLYVNSTEAAKKFNLGLTWEPSMGKINYFSRKTFLNEAQIDLDYVEIDGYILIPLSFGESHLSSFTDITKTFIVPYGNKEYIILQLLDNIDVDYNKASEILRIKTR